VWLLVLQDVAIVTDLLYERSDGDIRRLRSLCDSSNEAMRAFRRTVAPTVTAPLCGETVNNMVWKASDGATLLNPLFTWHLTDWITSPLVSLENAIDNMKQPLNRMLAVKEAALTVAAAQADAVMAELLAEEDAAKSAASTIVPSKKAKKRAQKKLAQQAEAEAAAATAKLEAELAAAQPAGLPAPSMAVDQTEEKELQELLGHLLPGLAKYSIDPNESVEEPSAETVAGGQPTTASLDLSTTPALLAAAVTDTGKLEQLLTCLRCPMTGSIMREPAIGLDGMSYERTAVEGQIGAGRARPNMALRQLIRDLSDIGAV
jgi:hypothetical protein